MEKRKKAAVPAEGVDEIELTLELERLLNENNALLKVLEKLSPVDAPVGKEDRKPEGSPRGIKK